ncbi:hypothetical protein C0991_001508, partial [Blastosporella zonata]
MAARKGGKQPIPPGLSTRPQNKATHPAKKAGVAPIRRRPHEEIAREKEKIAHEKEQKIQRDAHARVRAAQIEDRLHQEDLDREIYDNTESAIETCDEDELQKTQLGKIFCSKKLFTVPQAQSTIETTDNDSLRPRHGIASLAQTASKWNSSYLNIAGELGSDDGSEGDEYEDEGSGEDEQDDEVEDVEVEQPAKRRRNTRDDISALRVTGISSGKRRSSNVSEAPNKKTKTTSSKKLKALNADWQSFPSTRLPVPANPKQSGDSDSMVTYGGFVNDEENDWMEIDGTSTFTPRTQRELRGGTKKWTLSHLPNGTSDDFTNLLLPRVRRINGSLAPWSTLSTQQLQDIVDDVFGEGAQHVSDDANVWKGLTSYRLNDWRNGFITVARNLVKNLFSNVDDFPDEQAIKRAVKWYTHVHKLKTPAGKLKTAAYQWRQWKDNGYYKKTLAEAHLDNIDVQPSKRDSIEELPIGALIHSLQAVEHALKEYETGTCVINKRAGGHYSADNYGDRKERKVDSQGSPVIKEDARASRYISTIKAFKEKHWDIIFEEAGEHLLRLTPRRGK